AADRPRRYTRSKSALRVNRGRLCRIPPRRSFIATGPASDRQARTSLPAPALDREAAGTRAHPSTEPVRSRALALLRLVRSLHQRGRVAARIRREPDAGAQYKASFARF